LLVVFDASSVVGVALGRDGVPRRALLATRSRGSIVLSSAVHDEIRDVLGRPKFAAALTPDLRQEILELLTAAAVWTEPSLQVTDCRDTKENKYLKLALAAEAAVIVSSDDDLLVLDPWRGVRIMRPAEFLALPLT
jgi:uncharacterized protein